MLYDLIGKALEQRGLTRYKKSKFYDFSSCIVERGFIYYDAIDICLEFIEDRQYGGAADFLHDRRRVEKTFGRSAERVI